MQQQSRLFTYATVQSSTDASVSVLTMEQCPRNFSFGAEASAGASVGHRPLRTQYPVGSTVKLTVDRQAKNDDRGTVVAAAPRSHSTPSLNGRVIWVGRPNWGFADRFFSAIHYERRWQADGRDRVQRLRDSPPARSPDLHVHYPACMSACCARIPGAHGGAGCAWGPGVHGGAAAMHTGQPCTPGSEKCTPGNHAQQIFPMPPISCDSRDVFHDLWFSRPDLIAPARFELNFVHSYEHSAMTTRPMLHPLSRGGMPTQLPDVTRRSGSCLLGARNHTSATKVHEAIPSMKTQTPSTALGSDQVSVATQTDSTGGSDMKLEEMMKCMRELKAASTANKPLFDLLHNNVSGFFMFRMLNACRDSFH